MNALILINALAGLIVLAEALRCLEHAQPLAIGMTGRQRGFQALGVLAWLALASASSIAIAGPVLSFSGPPICWDGLALTIGADPSIIEVMTLVGAAVIVVRGWVK